MAVETLDYSELMEEKNLWDKRARTVQDDIELRGSLKNSSKQLTKSRAYICKLLRKSRKRNMLLDIGCGNKLFTTPLADIFNFVVGIDVSKEMMKRCKEKRHNIEFMMASATDLPLKDGAFDAALSLSLLQHLRTRANVEAALKELSRATTDDSFVFITFWDTPISPLSFVKGILKREKYKVKQSLISMLQFTRLQFTRYVKLYARAK